MLDKTVSLFKLVMRAEEGAAPREEPKLPHGYRFETYKAGDAAHWAAIECSVGEFDGEAAALERFTRVFMSEEDMLPGRMYFVVDPDGRYVATATAWYFVCANQRYAGVHFVGVRPDCQGLGLGRAVVQKVMLRHTSIEKGLPIILRTQTWSHPAIGLYLSLGFRALREDGLFGIGRFDEAVRALDGAMRPDALKALIKTAL